MDLLDSSAPPERVHCVALSDFEARTVHYVGYSSATIKSCVSHRAGNVYNGTYSPRFVGCMLPSFQRKLCDIFDS